MPEWVAMEQALQASPAVPETLRTVAPLHGETTVNAQGRALLQLCVDNSAEILSGWTMSAPTCIGHGRNKSTRVWATLWWIKFSGFAAARRAAHPAALLYYGPHDAWPSSTAACL